MEGVKVENEWTTYGPIIADRDVRRKHRNCWIYLEGISWLQNNAGCEQTTTYGILREALAKTYGMPYALFDTIWAEKLTKPKTAKVVEQPALTLEQPIVIPAVADKTIELTADEDKYVKFLTANLSKDKAEAEKQATGFFVKYNVSPESQAKIVPILKKLFAPKQEVLPTILTFS